MGCLPTGQHAGDTSIKPGQAAGVSGSGSCMVGGGGVWESLFFWESFLSFFFLLLRSFYCWEGFIALYESWLNT